MDKIAFKLQERLVQTCIDFINEHKDDEQVKQLQVVEFIADNLQISAEAGEWSSCTDSVCTLTGIKSVPITEDKCLKEPYIIDESY